MNAAPGSSTTPDASQPIEPPHPWPLLSLAALTVLELSPRDQVHCAAQAGYDHVGLRLVPATPDEPAWDSVGDTALMRATRKALDDTGLRVLDIEVLRLKPHTRAGDFARVLETAAMLSARYLLIAGNDPEESRMADNLAQLCELARPLRLFACVEPMPWTDVRDIGQALRVVERTGADNAGVLIDAIHFDRADSRPEQLADIPPARLPYMQLCDAPARRPGTIEAVVQQSLSLIHI